MRVSKSRRVEIQRPDLGSIEDVSVNGGPEAEEKGVNKKADRLSEKRLQSLGKTGTRQPFREEVSALLGPRYSTAGCESRLSK